jgi:hypothetical protein
MYRRLWLGLGVFVLFSRLAWAARPLDTEDPGTVPQGKGELQGSVDAAKGDDGALVGLRGSLGFGLLSTMDIRFQTALLWVDPLDTPSRVGMPEATLRNNLKVLAQSIADGIPMGDKVYLSGKPPRSTKVALRYPKEVHPRDTQGDLALLFTKVTLRPTKVYLHSMSILVSLTTVRKALSVQKRSRVSMRRFLLCLSR